MEQHALNHFKIWYTSERALTETEIETIKKALTAYLEDGLMLDFERVEVLDRSRRGKLKQFVSKL